MRHDMGSNKTAASGIDDMETSGRSKTALLIGITNLLVGVIAVAGNFLLCVTIYKDPYRRLRNTGSYLVVNLAVADLLTGLLTEPLYAAFEITNFMGTELGILYVIGETTAYVLLLPLYSLCGCTHCYSACFASWVSRKIYFTGLICISTIPCL